MVMVIKLGLRLIECWLVVSKSTCTSVQQRILSISLRRGTTGRYSLMVKVALARLLVCWGLRL